MERMFLKPYWNGARGKQVHVSTCLQSSTTARFRTPTAIQTKMELFLGLPIEYCACAFWSQIRMMGSQR